MTKKATIIEIITYKRLDIAPRKVPLTIDERKIHTKKTKNGQKNLLVKSTYCFFKKNRTIVIIDNAIRAILGKKYSFSKETEPSKGSKPTKHTKKA